MNNPSKQIPLSRALLLILLSTLMVSGTALMATLYYLHVKEMRLHDSQYRIVALVQECDQKEPLKTGYLAQLLDLSVDQPTNLYKFNIKEGERKLMSCPLIKKAVIQKISPGTLFVQYQVRIPVAYLGDYTNTAIDSEGYLFPFQPFFTPKKVPVIYLGIESQWGDSIDQQDKFVLVLDLLKNLEPVVNESMYVKQIDVSDAFSESYGNRQIVVILTSLIQGNSYILRLNAEQYKEGLENFRLLKNNLKEQHPLTMIDFRISHLAFIKQQNRTK
jgi:hypothetical protein